MRKSMLFFIALGLMVIPAMAQTITVRGVAVSATGATGVEAANVRLLHGGDSTVVTSSTTDVGGRFVLKAPIGHYILHISSIGFAPYRESLKLATTQPELILDTIRIASIDMQLSEAEVVHTLARMEQLADTTVYNTGAFRVPEGSTLETLIAQLPGVVVQEDGTIKWNGKTVKEFRTNGKDFFKGNTTVAMKNVPADIVSKVKAYDKKSDFSEQTGIDDGEETTVLDLTLKRELNETIFANFDLAGGTQKRHTNRLFGNYFNDRSRVTLYAGLNNTNDRGFMGGGGRIMRTGGAGASEGDIGFTTRKSVGGDFVWENGKQHFEMGRLEVGGDWRWTYSDRDLITMSTTERFLTTGASSAFGNSWSRTDRRNLGAAINLRVFWSPDSMTSVFLRPSLMLRNGNNAGNTQTATFSSNPYELGANPLDALLAGNTTYQSILVNTNWAQNMSKSKSADVDVHLGVTRRLNRLGRSVSLRANYAFSHATSRSYSWADIKYYNVSSATDRFNNQYSYLPADTWKYSVQLAYTEPIVRGWLLQGNYQYAYTRSTSERSLYSLDSLAGWDSRFYHPLGTLPTTADSLMLAYNMRNSNRAVYSYHDHSAGLGVQYNSKQLWMRVGAEVRPQYTILDYLYQGKNLRVTRQVVNLAPNVRITYRPNETTHLQATYRGRTAQPSMTNLLEIIDDSNPLNIVVGNPELKPSWTHSADLVYNTYNTLSQRGFTAAWQFYHITNGTANRTFYNQHTGVTTTKPVNVTGNWSTAIDLAFNTPLTSDKRFTLSNNTRSGYEQTIGFVTENNIADAGIRSHTRTFNVYDKLSVNYRREQYDVEVFGSLDYHTSTNALYTMANMNTYAFVYGASVNVTLPWNISLSTDVAMNSRRGYTESAMNTNELIWNAKISKAFLRNKAATLSLEFFDILDRESNVSRLVTSAMRRDTYNSNLGTYMMLHFTYRLTFLGGGAASVRKSSGSDMSKPSSPHRQGRYGSGFGGYRGGL